MHKIHEIKNANSFVNNIKNTLDIVNIVKFNNELQNCKEVK